MQHFLSLDNVTSDELCHLFQLARDMKHELKQGANEPQLAGKTLAMLFEKPSLRTRVSFDMGMIHLGGKAIYLSPSEVGLGKRESVADVARVLGRYVHAIRWRGFDHQHGEALAAYAGVPVINGLSDDAHPCQALTDLFTLWERWGFLKGLKLAYIGDGNNIARSLAYGCAKLGLHFVCASPEGYNLTDDVVLRAQAFAAEAGGKIEVTLDPYEAVHDAHVVYTDVWTSMGQEEESQQRVRIFQAYQVNRDLVEAARPDVVVMHDLPAHRGEEITDDVADGARSIIFDQAENRLHAQKALLVALLTG